MLCICGRTVRVVARSKLSATRTGSHRQELEATLLRAHCRQFVVLPERALSERKRTHFAQGPNTNRASHVWQIRPLMLQDIISVDAAKGKASTSLSIRTTVREYQLQVRATMFCFVVRFRPERCCWSVRHVSRRAGDAVAFHCSFRILTSSRNGGIPSKQLFEGPGAVGSRWRL